MASSSGRTRLCQGLSGGRREPDDARPARTLPRGRWAICPGLVGYPELRAQRGTRGCPAGTEGTPWGSPAKSLSREGVFRFVLGEGAVIFLFGFPLLPRTVWYTDRDPESGGTEEASTGHGGLVMRGHEFHWTWVRAKGTERQGSSRFSVTQGHTIGLHKSPEAKGVREPPPRAADPSPKVRMHFHSNVIHPSVQVYITFTFPQSIYTFLPNQLDLHPRSRSRVAHICFSTRTAS